MTIKCIRKCKFLFGRDRIFLKLLADSLEQEFFEEGDDIIKEGDDGYKMYFLANGRVQVLVGTNQQPVATLESGTGFGEMALLGLAKRTATVRALEPCDCRFIYIGKFQELLHKFPNEKHFFTDMAQERLQGLVETKQLLMKQPGSTRSSTKSSTTSSTSSRRTSQQSTRDSTPVQDKLPACKSNKEKHAARYAGSLEPWKHQKIVLDLEVLPDGSYELVRKEREEPVRRSSLITKDNVQSWLVTPRRNSR